MTEIADTKTIRDLLQTFVKAKKNLRIYPSNNPIYGRTVQDTYRKLNDALEFMDAITLRITRTEILCGGEPVFQGTGREDNLALFFSRDGLKELMFERGITQDEFQMFLEILAYDFESEDVVDDVVTLMWEKDFHYIKYQVDEGVLMEDEEDYETEAVEQAKEHMASDDDLARAYDDALKGDEIEDIALIPITEKDIKFVRYMIDHAEDDKKHKLINILFLMLKQADDFYEFHEIVSILEHALEYSVRMNDLPSAVEIFRRAREYKVTQNQEFDVQGELAHMCSFISSSEMIKVAGEILDTDKGVDERLFIAYASNMNRDSIPHLITMLGELKTIGARKNVVNALIRIARKDITVLARSLSDRRWYVVRNIIFILRNIGDPAAVNYLLGAVNHSDVRVRKEVLKTIGELGGQKAAAAIRACMDDPDVTVRTTAVKALGTLNNELAKRILLERILDKRFLFSEFNEKKECFEVLSKWRDPDVEDFLLKTIKKTVFFKRAKNNEMKAAAAYALGLIGDRGALPVLEKMRRSSNRFLNEYAYAAIKRIEYGKR